MRAEFTIADAEAVRYVPPVRYADYVLDALAGWRAEGLRTCLVTLIAIDGSSPRPLGSQIAVAEDGRALGAITGGCAEQAVVLDALSAIDSGSNHSELYGKGSRFKDIVLPCGSGVLLHFDVTLSDDALDALVTAHRDRRMAAYECPGPDGVFTRIYMPQSRLVIFGRGNVVPAMAQLGRLSEYDTLVFCPDDWTRDLCAPFARVAPLQGWDTSLIDSHCAVVSLFHDHDYEPDILHAALQSDAFFIGALGSRRTHAARLETLARRGWSSNDLQRISGPVGLDIGARTPPEIALSIMSEIVGTVRRGSSTEVPPPSLACLTPIPMAGEGYTFAGAKPLPSNDGAEGVHYAPSALSRSDGEVDARP